MKKEEEKNTSPLTNNARSYGSSSMTGQERMKMREIKQDFQSSSMKTITKTE